MAWVGYFLFNHSFLNRKNYPQPRLALSLSKLRPQTPSSNASRQWERSNPTSRPSLLIPRVKSWTWVLQARSAFLDIYYKRGKWFSCVFGTNTVMAVDIGTTKSKHKAWWKRINTEHCGCIREMKVSWTRKATYKVKIPIEIRYGQLLIISYGSCWKDQGPRFIHLLSNVISQIENLFRISLFAAVK